MKRISTFFLPILIILSGPSCRVRDPYLNISMPKQEMEVARTFLNAINNHDFVTMENCLESKVAISCFDVGGGQTKKSEILNQYTDLITNHSFRVKFGSWRYRRYRIETRVFWYKSGVKGGGTYWSFRVMNGKIAGIDECIPE